MSSHQRMGAVTPNVMKDAGGSVAVQRLSQAAAVAKVNLVGARDKRSLHEDDGLDGSVHVECEHGFVLISGMPDETLQPMCYKKKCKQQCSEWFESHKRQCASWSVGQAQETQQCGKSDVVARRCLVGAQKGELVITSLSFDPFDSRHPGLSRHGAEPIARGGQIGQIRRRRQRGSSGRVRRTEAEAATESSRREQPEGQVAESNKQEM